MSIHQAINAGEYKSKLPVPAMPVKPDVLKASVKDLSDQELMGIPAIRSQYEADLESYKQAMTAYREDSGRLANKFETDLAAEYGVSENPKRSLLWSKAYERGHSCGFSEIASCYADYVELII